MSMKKSIQTNQINKQLSGVLKQKMAKSRSMGNSKENIELDKSSQIKKNKTTVEGPTPIKKTEKSKIVDPDIRFDS